MKSSLSLKQMIVNANSNWMGLSLGHDMCRKMQLTRSIASSFKRVSVIGMVAVLGLLILHTSARSLGAGDIEKSNSRATAQPNLKGSWMMSGKLCFIEQSGSALKFYNEKAEKSAGTLLSNQTVVANQWNGGNGLVGRVSARQIVWNNGSVWTKATDKPTAIAGSWVNQGAATHIRQDVGGLTLTNERGEQSPAVLISPVHIQAKAWGNIIGASYNGQITWSNGTSWTKVANLKKPDVTGDWNFGGKATYILQSGDNLTFYNENGGVSSGRFTTPSHFVATDWGNLTGRIQNNSIYFANGSVWIR